MTTDVAVIVGSLRKGSFSRALARAMQQIGAKDLTLDLVEIGDLPLYNPDLDEGTPPAAWTAFRDRMTKAQAVLFVTPEYNRSIPGAMKNALDVGSRPYGKSVWDGKPAAIVSQSPGNLSGFGANHHLRQPLVFLNMPVMQQPEAYIANSSKLLDEAGNLTNDDTKAFLGKVLDSFAAWIARTR